MFVLERAKARTAAIVLSAVAGIQMFPTANADPSAGIVKEAETKSQKKIKKKKSDEVTEKKQKTEKVDPIDVLIKTAKKQLGDPYVWAAEGPNAFDCSGFTKYVYGKIGIELPHNSGAQRAATKAVPLDEMKRGDIIFAPGHVGLYLGKGLMIHSPRSGRVVSIDPIHSNAYGAGRPHR